MAKSFCPEWVYNVAVSRTAYEFIIAEMPIRSYAKKYAIGLSEVFNEIKFEEIENEAELLLRFLVEMNTDNADELLNFYVYYTLKFENQILYFGVNEPEENFLSYSLPPKPPTGGKDIRFLGDTKLCVSNECYIEVMNPSTTLKSRLKFVKSFC